MDYRFISFVRLVTTNELPSSTEALLVYAVFAASVG